MIHLIFKFLHQVTLIGRSLLSLPEASYVEVNPSHLRRWQLLNQIRDSFWRRWSRDYLQSLQPRGKLFQENPNLKIGDLVLITSEIRPPSKWPLGRVVNIHPGKDGLVRVATIRTSNNNLCRAVAKLIYLPFN